MRWWCGAAALVAAVWSGSPWPLLAAPVLIRRRWRFGLVLLLCWLHGLVALHHGLAARLPEALNGVTLAVQARVEGLPVTETAFRYGEPMRHQRLQLRVRLTDNAGRWPGWHRVRVSSWAPLPVLGAGDRFQGEVRLYFPHGWYNQSGVDRTRIDLSQGIDGRGALLTVAQRRPGQGGLAVLRERLSARLFDRLSRSPLGAAVIPALVAGDRRGIDEPLWSLFRELGTAHLLAISGLHLSLVVALLWGLGRAVLAPLAQCLIRPARAVALQQLAWWPALAGAAGYAALAGFAVPTRRALIMVVVLAVCRWRRRALPAGKVLAMALVVVLLIDPLAALSEGLWLSFSAVAAITLLTGAGGRWPVMVALPTLMAALSGWLFDAWGWWSPLANLVLVPLFSLLVVPLALLGALFDHSGLLLAAASGVELATAIMEAMQSWPAPSLPPLSAVAALALLGAGLLMLLPAWPWPRRLLPLWLLPWWLPAMDLPGPGQVDMVVFEVGQGQAIALRTRHHVLLYDVGPGWPGGSAARRVLVPWLREQRRTPTLTLVSHGDSDHAGGLADLTEVGRLLSGEPDRVPGAGQCLAGQRWQFDGVLFTVVWPPRSGAWRGNAASCVLRVQAAGASALLTGDITDQVEYRLLGSVAPVTVLQLAHHGSASANTAAWIAALEPRWAVASAGYANRFGHPNGAVIHRLREAGVTLLRTDRDGMIVFRLGGLDNAALITKWRFDHGRPWHRPGSDVFDLL
ncbi:DNA internalization-related competence protein ComEC/Rec2 [Alloalcanivorax mobilis]|uniref:DNA internalization-related competence protein ComEC/Rec2 n=1 Tax=Alloalcanivorax mobilis TaxID=2019569 RepID=UPI000C758665|nr:DNA internalization-related competence protein ComEC/Rec2 [Alloalcanivorax mobilis]